MARALPCGSFVPTISRRRDPLLAPMQTTLSLGSKPRERQRSYLLLILIDPVFPLAFDLSRAMGRKGYLTMDRYQLLLALYHYCLGWHSGIRSREYRLLCRITRVFRPSHSEEYAHCLWDDENAQALEIYTTLVKNYQHETVSRESLA